MKSYFNHTLKNAQIEKNIVLLRLDLNLPLDQNLKPVSDFRLERSIDTIKFLEKKASKIVIISHLGKPSPDNKNKFSLKNFIPLLEKKLKQKIGFLKHKKGKLPDKKEFLNLYPNNKIILLENLRFEKGEIDNDPDFIAEFAKLGDSFVNDAFSVAHRNHASITGIAQMLPSYPGFALEREINALNAAYDASIKPKIAIIGGKKISCKIGFIEKLLQNIDCIIIAGAMANNFLKIKGYKIGKSFFEKNYLKQAEQILKYAQKENKNIILPVDVVVAQKHSDTTGMNVEIHAIEDNQQIFDIGSQTVINICDEINDAKLLIWNGPLGYFENPAFAKASKKIVNYVVAKIQKSNGEKKPFIAIAGGGDSAYMLDKTNALEMFTHVSSGGGAFLQWLEGKKLPGITALENANNNKLKSNII